MYAPYTALELNPELATRQKENELSPNSGQFNSRGMAEVSDSDGSSCREWLVGPARSRLNLEPYGGARIFVL